MKPQILAGLIDGHTEFFSVGNRLHTLHQGSAYAFKQAPSQIHKLLKLELAADPDALQALEEWGITEPMDQLKQFAWCRFGGADSSPDLTSCGNFSPDYHDCGQRGTCPFEGRICVNKHGFTKRELQILKAIATGEMQKCIASRLGISEVTVAKFRKRLFEKTNSQSSVDLTRFALQHNYVSYE